MREQKFYFNPFAKLLLEFHEIKRKDGYTIKFKGLKSYFFSHKNKNLEHIGFPAFHIYRHYFSPFYIYLASTLIFLFGGFFHRTALILGLTLLIIGIGLFFIGLMISQKIVFQRSEMLEKYVEGDVVNIEVILRNLSGFILYGAHLNDHFGPGLNSEVRRVFMDPLLANQKCKMKYSVKCDGGMGSHTVGPMNLIISDPFGIFEFSVFNYDVKKVEVLPKIEEVPALQLVGSPHSTTYGHYEVQQRGLSINFSGIRPYTLGDSPRHIAWKISAKSLDLQVKEFEKTVNAEVNFVLDFNPAAHVGTKSQSTWEYCRDLTLSLMSQQIEYNNSVRLITNHQYSELGRGENHFHSLCYQMIHTDPEKEIFQKPDSLFMGVGSELVKNSYHLMSQGASCVYISPFISSNFQEIKQSLIELFTVGINVYVFFIDINTIMPMLVRKLGWSSISHVATSYGIDSEIDMLNKVGIFAKKIDCQKGISV